MAQLENKNEQELLYCTSNDGNNNDTLFLYLGLDNRGEDPLREPEVTVNFNEGVILSHQPVEEPEEDLFDFEMDLLSSDGSTDSEEQVVPSSELSSGYKYLDELSISYDEEDEGIYEDEAPAHELELMDESNRHNSQPP